MERGQAPYLIVHTLYCNNFKLAINHAFISNFNFCSLVSSVVREKQEKWENNTEKDIEICLRQLH